MGARGCDGLLSAADVLFQKNGFSLGGQYFHIGASIFDLDRQSVPRLNRITRYHGM